MSWTSIEKKGELLGLGWCRWEILEDMMELQQRLLFRLNCKGPSGRTNILLKKKTLDQPKPLGGGGQGGFDDLVRKPMEKVKKWKSDNA